jgi:hypothetical protein
MQPKHMHHLVLALHLTGDAPGAIETVKKAISILPPELSGLRTAMEESLAKYDMVRKQGNGIQIRRKKRVNAPMCRENQACAE